jgi:hypothetical protein
MNSYDGFMMDQFKKEDLKQLLIEYFQLQNGKVPLYALELITNDLIANKGNLVNYYVERYPFNNWDNFIFVGLAEVYKQWQTKHIRTKSER